MRKKHTIKSKIIKISLTISILSLLIASGIGIFSMIKIQADNRAALVAQMEDNIRNILNDKVSIAELDLLRYIDYIDNFAKIIHDMYINPVAYGKTTALPPIKGNLDYALQRLFVNETIKYDDVKSELELLANIEKVWKSIITSNNIFITTIYIGTKSGFMLSYDRDSNAAANDDSSDIYYNYFDSTWYKIAKNRYKKASFTNIYSDVYGRGLTISCAEPFYDANDEFAGVVCLDILISDLYQSLINLNSNNYYTAFLVDSVGNLISSNEKSDINTNIMYVKEIDYSVSNAILRSETGVKKANNYYYGYKPIPNTNWKYCIYIQENLIFSTIDTLNYSICVITAIFLIIIVIIIILVIFASQELAIHLTIPITDLENTAESISDGNFSSRAKVYDNDEIGNLANKINTMAMAIQWLVKCSNNNPKESNDDCEGYKL